MANIMFKRGLQANLPQTAVDGSFYLTEDTQRLYVGIGENNAPVELNRTIRRKPYCIKCFKRTCWF